MGTGGKLFTGVAATVLMGLIGHFSTGDKFVAGLEESAKTELTGAGHGWRRCNL